MSEIPEDVMRAAVAAEQACIDLPANTRAQCEEIIARAIMAERERCAKKIDPLPLESDATSYEKQAYDLRLRFAAAIRAGIQP